MLYFKDKRLVVFGIHVRGLRESKGMGINDIVQNTTLTKKDLVAIEEGSKNFGFTTLLELAKGLGEDPSRLLEVNFTDDQQGS